MASEWAGIFQESAPYQAGELDPAGMLRYGCGLRANRVHLDADPLPELADAIEAAVPELVRHKTLFIESDKELHGSDLTHLPPAFVVLMSRAGATPLSSYGVSTTTPALELVRIWLVAKSSRPGPSYVKAQGWLYSALAALREL